MRLMHERRRRRVWGLVAERRLDAPMFLLLGFVPDAHRSMTGSHGVLLGLLAGKQSILA